MNLDQDYFSEKYFFDETLSKCFEKIENYSQNIFFVMVFRRHHAINDPINLIDPSGMSYIVYKKGAKIAEIYSKDGKLLGSFPAGNNVASGSPAGEVPLGIFNFSHYQPHPESNADGPFGSNGNFVFKFPNGSGIGIHSGRMSIPDKKGRTGTEHATNGCIRSTDSATSLLSNIMKTDPLEYINVVK